MVLFLGVLTQHAPTAPPNAYPPIASSSGGLGAAFGSAQDKSCTFNGQPISCTELAHQADIGNVVAEYIRDGQLKTGAVSSSGLGVITFWVEDDGPKKGPAGEDTDGVVRVNKDEDGLGHYESFLLSVAPQKTLTGQHHDFPTNNKSACANFADSLVARLSANYSRFMTPVALAPFGDLVAAATGLPMVKQAIKDVDERGVAYKKGVYPITGSRGELTDNNQDADVYHHILFVAGNSLLGEPGAAANAAFIAVDAKQAYIEGRKESETELRDDRAGLKVGGAMMSAAHSGKFDALRNQITGILCNH